jgi:hypothetical protein
MSFSLTTKQIRNRTKTVTRRKGWLFLKPGDVLNACVKCQGLKPGEKIQRLCQIWVVSVRREPLWDIVTQHPLSEVRREGFPRMSAREFVVMFCKHMGGGTQQTVTRIEFEYT